MTKNRANAAAWALLVIAGLAAPFLVYPVFAMKILCLSLFACAFNLLVGYTGLLSFGHATFLGSAGYIAGHTIKVLGFPPELGILAGTATAAGLGYVIGGLAIRRSGIYFAMITLALAQMVYFMALQMPFTGGEDGLPGVPGPAPVKNWACQSDVKPTSPPVERHDGSQAVSVSIRTEGAPTMLVAVPKTRLYVFTYWSVT